MTSTTPSANRDTDAQLVLQNFPTPGQKNYNIFRIFFNQTRPVTKHHSNPGLDGVQEQQVLDDDFGRTINIIGLLVALLVSVIIIVGVAFVIRKIRKRQASVDEDEEANDREKTTEPDPNETSISDSTTTDPDIPQVFTITFEEVPKKEKKMVRAIPKCMRPKPKQVDIEKIKRELSHVYVY